MRLLPTFACRRAIHLSMCRSSVFISYLGLRKISRSFFNFFGTRPNSATRGQNRSGEFDRFSLGHLHPNLIPLVGDLHKHAIFVSVVIDRPMCVGMMADWYVYHYFAGTNPTNLDSGSANTECVRAANRSSNFKNLSNSSTQWLTQMQSSALSH